FIFCLMLVYLIIMNMITTLKTSIYRLSSTSQISIFFLVGMYFLANKGFTNIFRIAGYTSVFACIYLAIVMISDIAQFDINNIFPILGNGANNVFLVNLQNICIFTPIFFILLFNNNMDDKKNIGEKNNLNNFYKIISISSFFVITLISVIILTFPPELITNRYSIITDINKIISHTATALQSTPILIFIYSFITFISASFFVLTSTYILEKLNVTKNHKKIVNINILLVAITLYFSDSFALKNIMDIIFKYSSIAIVFIFPILTILINKIKEKIHA
ncbi:MAG: GerAB/ArcD/ProY family transporter, partial [Clostridia bacterium]